MPQKKERPPVDIEVDIQVAASWSSGPSRRASVKTYTMENDTTQSVRLNLQHHLVRQRYDGQNYRGISQEELERGVKVLDVGCGSGIWLAEMQRDFPKGEYVGLDIQRTEWVEAFQELSGNKITLVEGDVLRKLPFDDQTFDYVHMQNMFAAIPAGRWPDVIAELFRIGKPGAFIDLVEIEVPDFPNEPPTEHCTAFDVLVKKVFSARGINGFMGRELRTVVNSVHLFEEVECIERFAPLGWTPTGESEEIGRLWAWDYRRILDGLGGLFSSAMGKTTVEWNTLVERWMEDFAEVKATMAMYRVVANRRH
ncbi:S-adenosyl-L-methionine-dependent methyltransferase [Cladochytrium replicatum]|nr:S-adenosyl-L-methionine-dependent methyltransferase [Cladochytrium replicatum]